MGLFNSKKTIKYDSGDKYIGEVKNGKQHGKCTMFFADGTTQSGIWENDELVSVIEPTDNDNSNNNTHNLSSNSYNGNNVIGGNVT